MDNSKITNMTTREVYFKGLYYCKKCYGTMKYVYQDDNGIFHTNGFIIVYFSRDEEISSRNINRMIEAEKRKGFKFWLLSPEGEKFTGENVEVLGSQIIDNLFEF